MNENQYQELLAMIVAIYKKVGGLERKGGMRAASSDDYLSELRKLASEIYFRHL